jgi:NTE family protein
MQNKSIFTICAIPLLLIMLIYIFEPYASAQIDKNRLFSHYKKRPKIALVLSGGGAKGIAHVGVLKIIEKTGLQIDYITGTSMGSIVGGLYASGYTADMLEQLVLNMDWDAMLADEISRRSTSIEEKGDHDRYITSFQIAKKGIMLPTGFKRGQQLTTMMSQLTQHVQDIRDFDNLPIPFRCIGTDIVTGKAYIIKKGSLSEAMRASMAIPSIFTPIEIDGHLLVDGGVIRNLPVSDARAMGADIVIAVDVGAPLYKKDELTSVIQIMDQSVSFLGYQSTQKERNLSDVLIMPNIAGFGSNDFNKGKELIAVGEEAGRLIIPELEALLAQQDRFPEEKKAPIFPIKLLKKLDLTGIKVTHKMKITKIDIRGLDRVSRNLVLGKLNINPPAMVTGDRLVEAIDRVYASGFFQRVTYELEPGEGDGTTLVIRVIEMSGIFLKVGLSYDSDMSAAVLLNVTLRNMAGKGSKIFLGARPSQYPGVVLSYFIHTGLRKPGVGFGLKFHYDQYTIFTYKAGDLQSSFKYHNYGPDIVAQAIILQDIALGVGVQKDFTNILAQIAPDDPKKQNIESLNFYAYLMYDNLDKTFYPRSGFQFYGEVKYFTDLLRTIKNTADFYNFFKYTVRMKGYIPFHKRFSLYLGVTGSFIKAKEPYYLNYDIVKGWGIFQRSIPFIYQNYFGGLNTYTTGCFPFTGLNFMQISGKNILIGDIGLQVEFYKDFFFILRGNVGRVKDDFTDLFRMQNIVWEKRYNFTVPIKQRLKNDLIYGYGLTVSYNSIIGPVELTLMRGSESNNFLVLANIGYRI